MKKVRGPLGLVVDVTDEEWMVLFEPEKPKVRRAKVRFLPGVNDKCEAASTKRAVRKVSRVTHSVQQADGSWSETWVSEN